MSWLWNELHDLFEEDDGSLPEIRVDYRDTNATVEGFSLLQDLAQTSRSTRKVDVEPVFWSVREEKEKPVASVPNAAALVVSGEAESFHLVLGINFMGTPILDLGVFVFPDQLALDYRMGPEWGPAEVTALFSLVLHLVRLDPDGKVSLEEGVIPEVVECFQGTWNRHVEEHAV